MTGRTKQDELIMKRPCESCSMPIETGTYCQYCVTPTGTIRRSGLVI